MQFPVRFLIMKHQKNVQNTIIFFNFSEDLFAITVPIESCGRYLQMEMPNSLVANFQNTLYQGKCPIFQHASIYHKRHIPVGIYLLKVNNRDTRTRCEMCSKLTIKTPEHIVNLEHISHLFLLFLLLTLNILLLTLPAGIKVKLV